MATSPELTGGAGFTFEDAVVANYLVFLLAEESAPGLNDRIVKRVAQQQAAFGEPMDDLVVDGIAPDGSVSRLRLQVKRELQVSEAASNADFRKILTTATATVEKDSFRRDIDRVGAATGFIAETSRRALTEVCEWARECQDAASFYKRFEEPGFAGQSRKEIISVFKTILADKSAEAIFQVMRHFVLVTFDFMHEGAKDDAGSIALLRKGVLDLADAQRAGDLWSALRVYAREGAGRAAEYTRPFLLTKLSSTFRFTPAQSLKAAIARLSEEADAVAASIPNQIDGLEVTRPAITEKIMKGIGDHAFAQLIGLPGTGKSVALRNLAVSLRQKGNALFLKSDRLNGNSWNAYATSIGLPLMGLEELLVEIGTTGTPMLLIDGLDRLGPLHRGVVLDILNIISASPLLANWKMVATLRDNGIEPVRTWLPARIAIAAGTGTIEVTPFDDDEAEFVAKERPILRPLLFGDDKVREIARRPFFCAVLLKSLQGTASSLQPRSEVELARVWWERGGYDASDTKGAHRRKALLALAKAGAEKPGQGISTANIDIDALEELRIDGVIAEDRKGHTVLFAHDIFFEWAFLEYLTGQGETWSEEIKRFGELPIFARSVELLSQSEFASNGNWEKHLDKLEASKMRAQWARSWTLGPLSSPVFEGRSGLFHKALVRTDTTRLERLPVWMMAEKSRANPRILATATGETEEDRRRNVQFADALAWPSDIATWRRFCSWILANKAAFPVQSIPDLVDALSIWQNMLGDILNTISQEIIAVFLEWLVDIEDRCHPEEFDWNRGPWEGYSTAELKELETALRTQVVRAAGVEKDKVAAYLRRVASRRMLRQEAAHQICQQSWRLIEHHAFELKDLVLAELLAKLPADVAKEPNRGMIPHTFGHYDWHQLALHDHSHYSPSSPLHEPFKSLFRGRDSVARELVRDIANHAILAWRQLFNLDYHRRATPIPVLVQFPWGDQTFWGDFQVYSWSRGHWASSVVSSGLMSLEEWAFAELKKAREIDDIIKDVVEGHKSISVLAIAVTLALQTEQVTPAMLSLIAAQRLWEYDINRSRQDGPLNPNLIGVEMLGGREHLNAVRAGNAREVRRLNIQALAMRVMLFGTDEQRGVVQASLRNFTQDLPFEYVEQEGNIDMIAHLKEGAENYAVLADMNNYAARPMAQNGQVQVIVNNPKMAEPAVQAKIAEAQQILWQFNLLGWADKSIRERKYSSDLTPEIAYAKAKELDHPGLFKVAHTVAGDINMVQGSVAATAAALLVLPPKDDDEKRKWATDVVYRAAQTPEVMNPGGLGNSGLHHPCVYAIRALSTMIGDGAGGVKAQEALLSLAAHPVMEIGGQAIHDAMLCWDRAPDLAWTSLRVLLNIANGVRIGNPNAYSGYDNEAQLAHTRKLVKSAIKELKSGKIPDSLPQMPNAWRADGSNPEYPKQVSGRRRSGRHSREPDTYLRWDLLQGRLADLPVERILADLARRPHFLELCYHFLKWTVERTAPPWMDRKERRRNPQATEIIQWRRALLRLLARVALELDVAETERKLLTPIFAMEDELAMDLIEPFVEMLISKGVMDDPEVSPKAITLVAKCVERSVATHTWNNARHNDGDIFGHSTAPFVRDILMVSVDRAPAAARFANGDWKDIGIVMPIIGPFVAAAGDIPFVTQSFLKMVERAQQHYPVETFADQVPAFLEHQSGTPVGWRGTMITSRIASLVQTMAERAAPVCGRVGQKLLRILDRLVEIGDRRSAALQTSELFRAVRI